MTTNTNDVLDAIREVRDMLLPHYGNVTNAKEKNDGAHDLVTELDTAVEDFLKKEFARIAPDITFVGEEFGGDRTAERFWLVDPIDATGAFVRGMPFCTTMVALIENGEVVFSAIYDFVNDVMYHAEKGKGAFANGEPIHVSDRPFRQAKLFYESDTRIPENADRYHALEQEAPMLRTMSAGHEYVMVAIGKMDGRITFNPYGNDYDFAPGALLVKEAGGVVTNFGSDTYDYTNLNFVAANPAVHKELTEGKYTHLFTT